MTDDEKKNYSEMGLMLFLSQLAIFALVVAIVYIKLKR